MESPNFSNHGRSSLVLFTPDLILLIFEALAEPCAAEDKSTTNYLPRCMLVCREWYYIVRKMIWSHLTKPHKAFDAVLFQYDSLTDLLSSKVILCLYIRLSVPTNVFRIYFVGGLV